MTNKPSGIKEVERKAVWRFCRALQKACKTQVPEKWEGEQDAWLDGYNAAIAENIKIAKEFVATGKIGNFKV